MVYKSAVSQTTAVSREHTIDHNSTKGQEDSRPDFLMICRWNIPHEQERWWPITSDYVELLWLPVLGPSSIVLLQRLDRLLGATPRTTIATQELASSLGLGSRPHRGSLLARSIDRCRDFHVLRELVPGTLEVPRELPPLSSRQLKRLPTSLQIIATQQPDLRRYRDIADENGRLAQLTATLANLGAEEDEISDQLLRLGYPPTSYSATRSHPAASARRSASQSR